jgi:saccharopine dehydrogenase-like NADP-dependent oxidoreductase
MPHARFTFTIPNDMKTILILGAGRSAYSLIQYLTERAQASQWHVTVGDRDLRALQSRFPDHPCLTKAAFDVMNAEQCNDAVAKADLVISMLPASFHPLVAKPCLKHGKHLLTASYVSEEMKGYHAEALSKGLVFLNEMGLDPGIDHLSAKKIIDHLHQQGAAITLFKSYTGGLIAPESDNNPWNYKFTWNPRNVVLAGQGTAKYIRNGQYKYVPYHQLFQHTDSFHIEGYGDFEGYPNRDSLQYREVYGLQGIPTMLRGTLRRKGFCNSWNTFVQLGLTDDTYAVEGSEHMTYREFLNAYLPYSPSDMLEEKLAKYLGVEVDSPEMAKLGWLGLFEREPIRLPNASPAAILQQVLERKWQLEEGDKDMTVMQHIFEYVHNGVCKQLSSSLVIIGDDVNNTAMAKGVGLPLAIAAKMLLEGRIAHRGVLRPIYPDLYEPVMEELESLGMVFQEHETVLG